MSVSRQLPAERRRLQRSMLRIAGNRKGLSPDENAPTDFPATPPLQQEPFHHRLLLLATPPLIALPISVISTIQSLTGCPLILKEGSLLLSMQNYIIFSGNILLIILPPKGIMSTLIYPYG